MVAGNGLSIACSRDLALGELTKVLYEELDTLSTDGSSIISAVQALSQRVERDPEPDRNDFEKLVGAFDTQTVHLQDLRIVSNAIEENPDGLLQSIDQVIGFTEKVRNMGVGIVLQAILERTPGVSTKTQPLINFLEAMKSDFGGRITFGNLNYDGLVLAAMLNRGFPVCDMANPEGVRNFAFEHRGSDGMATSVTSSYRGIPLHTEASTLPTDPAHRIRLVHPHGAINFLKGGDGIFKFPLPLFRQLPILSSQIYPESIYRPMVVLTNSSEKSRLVQEEPFKLAYEVLADGLRNSDHWLIAGYSFRDESINNMLRDIFRERTNQPKVLVSTLGDDPTDWTIRKAFGLDIWDAFNPGVMTINREGIEELPMTWDWAMFHSN